ncbi:hypothetical protein [Noviherbaspirillum saxi]|uniref:Uncharacterized protein n=1 Tax=Noviherbaspirillum saxi TaxID=2320863 RepID=A0A3A3FLF6_9BURK|nr:hypothetical protein [Noviherbaspirillum saxi]RJF96004.1 hypothetical protein D3871_21910 [Noviherbaspirillum saxi]
MNEFFAAYPALAWSIVSVMLAIVVMATLWDKIRWWWHNTWYSFPFIGGIARLSRDGNMDSFNSGWSKAERTLCRDYKKFIRIQDEHDFNEKISYLTKAGDIGRRETPGWIWLLTVAMVFVEAMGFSYVLAGYTLPGASENLQQTGAYGIAFLISVILVAFTHFAGHELSKSNQIKNARREWVEDNRQHKLTTGTVPLAKPQLVDDDQPTYTQLANRVGTHPSYVILTATCVFVVIIAAFATYVRGQVLEKQLQQQVTGQISQADVPKDMNDGLNVLSKANKALPTADLQANRAADVKAINDEANLDRHGGWGTFIVLAFVFVFLQILGVIFGYRWGFAGKNSAEAFRSIGKGRYATYADVREHYLEIAGGAQSKLEILQQKMMELNAHVGIGGRHLSKTFLDFMQESREEEAKDRDNEHRHTEAKAARSAASIKAPAPAAPAVVEQAKTPIVQQVLEQLDRMQDKEEKKSYLGTLPETLNQEVRAALKARKEEDERKKKESDAELEELL